MQERALGGRGQRRQGSDQPPPFVRVCTEPEGDDQGLGCGVLQSLSSAEPWPGMRHCLAPPRPGPYPPPYQVEVTAVVTAMCFARVLWSPGQNSAGSPAGCKRYALSRAPNCP